MGDFFKRNRLRFLLCILALLIGVLLYAAMQGGQTTGVMGVVLNPLRQVTQTVSKQAERLVTAFTNQTSYQTENDRLKEENAALKNKLLDYEDTKQQLTELEKFMGIKKNTLTMCFLTPVPSLDMSQTTPSTALSSTRVRMMALNCKTLW